jgi:hypothetical protein
MSRIALSAKGLQFADRISRKDFRFVSGSNVLVCDRFQAAFISPRVARLIATDPLIEDFSIESADSRSFDCIRQLICGEAIVVDESNIEILNFVIEALGNEELSSLLFEIVDKSEGLNVSNCISRLNRKTRMGIDVSRECSFLGCHFSEMKVDAIKSIEIDIMHDILRLDSLQIETEDWLLNFVIELGPSYSELIGDVRFEYLSPSSINCFFEHIQIHELNQGIWQQLWNRCRHRIAYDSGQNLLKGLRGGVVRSPESDSPFSGLISHLSSLCGGNVHEKGVIAITSSSNYRNNIWQIADYVWTDYWYGNNETNSWIQFDFQDRIVSLTGYALKSDGFGSHHLLQWTVTGSKDGNTWNILDRQNTQDLNGNFITKIYRCANDSSNSDSYRYIRLTQTAVNSSGNHHLMLSNIEFFGRMVNVKVIESLVRA